MDNFKAEIESPQGKFLFNDPDDLDHVMRIIKYQASQGCKIQLIAKIEKES